MDSKQHTAIVNFIWGIADDVLRDIYVRGKYRDVILPMTVIRRLDCLLVKTKPQVLETAKQLDELGITRVGEMAELYHGKLCETAGQSFFNTSEYTLEEMFASKNLKVNFEAYLDGFSDNIKAIIKKFEFRRQIDKLVDQKVLGELIEKFVDPAINLGIDPIVEGEVEIHPGLSNHGMGYVFEELLRKFNEENNEEAGEHFTPREVIHLMTRLVIDPVKDRLTSDTYKIYDCACGSGGMLTETREHLSEIASALDLKVSTHLYGQEINGETWAICQADLLILGEDADNIKPNSTLSDDGFPLEHFDFMLANPPYGKSWKTDLKRIGGPKKSDIHDPRFIINYADDPKYAMIPKSSDGQLLFLVNMLSKMREDTELGSRVATIHNGSSLFSGDAGGGESNIRRWIIEHDWLEAIVGMPENLFYNTGISTYIWVLSNRKPAHRKGKVQLIDARQWFTKLRRNLGQKNCELTKEDIQRILDTFIGFEEGEHSKIVTNESLGYWKITVERPLRLRIDLSEDARSSFRAMCDEAGEQLLADAVDEVAQEWDGGGSYLDFNVFLKAVRKAHKAKEGRWTQGRRKMLINGPVTTIDPEAECVIAKTHKDSRVEYEPDSNLRDTEQIPLDTEGGIAGYMKKEVLPHVDDAWVDEAKTKLGYEIPFTRFFFKFIPSRSLEVIEAEIQDLEGEIQILLTETLR